MHVITLHISGPPIIPRINVLKAKAWPSPKKFPHVEFFPQSEFTRRCPFRYDNSKHNSGSWCPCVMLINTEGQKSRGGGAIRRPVCCRNWKGRCQRLEAHTSGSCSPWWTHPPPHGQTASRCSPLQDRHNRSQPFSHTMSRVNTDTWLLVPSTQLYT